MMERPSKVLLNALNAKHVQLRKPSMIIIQFIYFIIKKQKFILYLDVYNIYSTGWGALCLTMLVHPLVHFVHLKKGL